MQNNETKFGSLMRVGDYPQWNVLVTSCVDNKILEEGVANEEQIRDYIDTIDDTCLYYDDEIINDIKEEIKAGGCAYTDPTWYKGEGWYICKKYFSKFRLLLPLEKFGKNDFSFNHNQIRYSFSKVGQ